MGTGKTSVGRLLADQFQFKFLDTDEMIEQRAGKTVGQIFEQDGEAAFRKFEQEILQEIGALKHVVISTGGGLGAVEANVASLKEHSLVVCLWAPPQTVWQRVQNQTHRPLLQTADPQEKICELLALREPVYRQADFLVNTEVRSVKEVAQHVGHEFYLATRHR